MGEKERSGWVILGVLAGLWVLPTLIIGSAVAYDTYWRAQIPKLADEWVECRECGIPSEETRAGKALRVAGTVSMYDGTCQLNLYSKMEWFDAQIADGSATPSGLRGEVEQLLIQSNGEYDSLCLIPLVLLMIFGTVFLRVMTILGKWARFVNKRWKKIETLSPYKKQN